MCSVSHRSERPVPVAGRVAATVYTVGVLIDPVFGYNSVPLLAVLCVCVVVAVLCGIRVWTLLAITVVAVGLVELSLVTRPYLKGPHGFIYLFSSH